MKKNKYHVCIRNEIDGPLIRTIYGVHRDRSGFSLAQLLINKGEDFLTVFQNQKGKAAQVLQGQHTGGWFTGGGDSPIFQHDPVMLFGITRGIEVKKGTKTYDILKKLIS